MRRREPPAAPDAPATAPPFDPADFVREPRDGFDAWAVTAAANLYVRRHGLAAGSPPHIAARAIAAAWLGTLPASAAD